MRPYVSNAVGDGNTFQPHAIRKRIHPYAGNAVGDGNAFQPPALRKRITLYAGNTAGDGTMSVIVNFVFSGFFDDCHDFPLCCLCLCSRS